MTPPSQPLSPTSSGIILAYHSNFYTVLAGHLTYQCFLKGILKKHATNVLVGDRVQLDNLDETHLTGRITHVFPRDNQLLRPKIANITHAVVVAALHSPQWSWEQVDRYLTHIQLAGIQPMICITKTDLGSSEEVQAIVDLYQARLNIPVFAVSISQPPTITGFFKALKGKTVVLAGLSGVGKSSLLNAYQPGLSLKTGNVSEKIQRGQHTTRHVTFVSLDNDTFVADTPGFSHLKFDTVDPATLENAFPEFTTVRSNCRFDNCLHRNEEGCSIDSHPETISPSRLSSYQVFSDEAQVFSANQQTTSRKEQFGYKVLHRGRQKDLQILRLNDRQRTAARNTQKQQWDNFPDDQDDDLGDMGMIAFEDDTLE